MSVNCRLMNFTPSDFAFANTSFCSGASVMIESPFRHKDFIDVYLKLFKTVFQKISDLRRAGSAALDLSYLACGRCEGFFEIGLSPWDIAAGNVLIREAGGLVTDFGGGNDFLLTGNVVAGNPAVHKQLLQEVKHVFGGFIDK